MIIFLDESGNLDFSAKGTKHFVLTAAVSYKPAETSKTLEDVKCRLLNRGLDCEYFHATEDLQIVRDDVFDAISKMNNIFDVYFAYAKKADLAEQTPSQVFARFGSELIIEINKHISFDEPIIMVFDRTLIKKEEKAFLSEIKPILKRSNRKYYILFHRTLSDFNAQVADYCSWAKYVSLERNEKRPLDSLKKLKMVEIQIRN